MIARSQIINCISRGREEKCGKVEKKMVGTSVGEDDEPDEEVVRPIDVDMEGERGVHAGGEAGTSDIVGAEVSRSSDGRRSDRVSVLVAAIAIYLLFLIA